MDSCGELVRKIRLEKGIRQNELYQDIISKSYSISFEKGKHDISLGLLTAILNRLRVSIDEFQYIQRGHERDQSDRFFVLFAEYGNANDFDKLGNLLNESMAVKTENARIRVALVRSRISQLKEFRETGKFSKSKIECIDRQVIVNHLTAVQTWTHFEMKLFANSIDYIEYGEKIAYFKLIIQFTDKYRKYGPAQDTICVLFTNLIYDLLIGEQLIQAKPLLNAMMTRLDELSKQPAQGFYKIIYRYYQGIMTIIYEGYLYNDREKIDSGESRARLSVIMLKELEQFFLADVYEFFLDQLLDEKEGAKLFDNLIATHRVKQADFTEITGEKNFF